MTKYGMMPGQAEYLQDSGPGPKAQGPPCFSFFRPISLRQFWANMAEPNIQIRTSPMFAAGLADRFDFDRFVMVEAGLYWLRNHFG